MTTPMQRKVQRRIKAVIASELARKQARKLPLGACPLFGVGMHVPRECDVCIAGATTAIALIGALRDEVKLHVEGYEVSIETAKNVCVRLVVRSVFAPQGFVLGADPPQYRPSRGGRDR